MDQVEGAAAGPWVSGEVVEWLLASDEPAAHWVTLTARLGRDAADPAVVAAHRELLADLATRDLVGRLPDWTTDQGLSGHDSPAFALNLLADIGVGAGEFAEIEHLLDIMLVHQEPGGRFASFGTRRAARSRSGARCCATPIPCWRC